MFHRVFFSNASTKVCSFDTFYKNSWKHCAIATMFRDRRPLYTVSNPTKSDDIVPTGGTTVTWSIWMAITQRWWAWLTWNSAHFILVKSPDVLTQDVKKHASMSLKHNDFYGSIFITKLMTAGLPPLVSRKFTIFLHLLLLENTGDLHNNDIF